ncbi:MAG: ABC transporter substrate-binding protein [Rhodopila sp.]
MRLRSLVTTALLGCLVIGGARAAEPNPSATLIYYDAVGNETLDPAEPQSGSSFSQEVLLALYDTIVRLDDKGNPGPGLAESWQVSPDLATYTFKLRQGVKFHDGSDLTADVVKRNIDRNMALGPKASGAMVDSIKPFASVEVLGPLEFRLNLKSPSGQIPFVMGGIAGMVASAASINDTDFGVTFKPVGSGAYRVQSFESNVKTVMARNDDYWGGTKGRPAAFQHHYVPDGRARLNAVRSGQATVALIDPRQIPEAKSAGLAVQINEKNGVWDIYINLGRTPMKDLKVRQAFMHAIDREALADALSFGSSKPTVQLFAQSSPVYDPALEKLYPYDPKKAKALLAEAGYKDGIELTQLLLNTTEYKQLGEALQAMLAESNIRVKFDVVDASQFNVFRRPPYRGDYLMARWGGRADPLQVFQELIATGATYNPVNVASPEIDTLIAKARGMLPSDPERIPTLRQIARVAVENVAQAPLMTRSNIYAYREGCIMNLTPYLPFGDDRFNDVQVAATCK